MADYLPIIEEGRSNLDHHAIGLIYHQGQWQVELNDGFIEAQWREPGINFWELQRAAGRRRAREHQRLSLAEARAILGGVA